ncbi:MAG: EVE domain-containing protein [Opitutaceae bacterium]|nr:EVE domain-containing protein [Cytophagales bacterium]
MKYWLLKSEPDVYSFDDLIKQKIGTWDGVRNYTARNNLKKMEEGDLAFFYHSNIGKEIVGIVKIVKEAFQDPSTDDHRWVAIEVSPVEKLKRTITLKELKENSEMQHLELVKFTRLSVMSIEKSDFEQIIKMSKEKAN